MELFIIAPSVLDEGQQDAASKTYRPKVQNSAILLGPKVLPIIFQIWLLFCSPLPICPPNKHTHTHTQIHTSYSDGLGTNLVKFINHGVGPISPIINDQSFGEKGCYLHLTKWQKKLIWRKVYSPKEAFYIYDFKRSKVMRFY